MNEPSSYYANNKLVQLKYWEPDYQGNTVRGPYHQISFCFDQGENDNYHIVINVEEPRDKVVHYLRELAKLIEGGPRDEGQN